MLFCLFQNYFSSEKIKTTKCNAVSRAHFILWTLSFIQGHHNREIFPRWLEGERGSRSCFRGKQSTLFGDLDKIISLSQENNSYYLVIMTWIAHDTRKQIKYNSLSQDNRENNMVDGHLGLPYDTPYLAHTILNIGMLVSIIFKDITDRIKFYFGLTIVSNSANGLVIQRLILSAHFKYFLVLSILTAVRNVAVLLLYNCWRERSEIAAYDHKGFCKVVDEKQTLN